MTKIADYTFISACYDTLVEFADCKMRSLLDLLKKRVDDIEPYIIKYPHLDIHTINRLRHCDDCQRMFTLYRWDWERNDSIYIGSIDDFNESFHITKDCIYGVMVERAIIRFSDYESLEVPVEFIEVSDEELDSYLSTLFTEGEKEYEALLAEHRHNREKNQRKKLETLLKDFGYPSLQEIEDKYGCPDTN